MEDEEAIGYWDEVHAPLGLDRPTPRGPARGGFIWPALLVGAAVLGALAGSAPAAWRALRPVVAQAPSTRPIVAQALPAPSAQSKSQEPLGLKNGTVSDVPPPAPPPAKPAPAKAGGAAASANANESGPLIINVAEALAATKRSAPDPVSPATLPSR